MNHLRVPPFDLPLTGIRRIIFTDPKREGAFCYDTFGGTTGLARAVAYLERLGYTVVDQGEPNGLRAGLDGAVVQHDEIVAEKELVSV